MAAYTWEGIHMGERGNAGKPWWMWTGVSDVWSPQYQPGSSALPAHVGACVGAAVGEAVVGACVGAGEGAVGLALGAADTGPTAPGVSSGTQHVLPQKLDVHPG